MDKGKVKDITVEILSSIRDEIKSLRGDTNKRLEQMDKRFEKMDKRLEQMDKRLERIEGDIKTIVSRFDRDYLLLASETEDIKRRLVVCEKKLNITSN